MKDVTGMRERVIYANLHLAETKNRERPAERFPRQILCFSSFPLCILQVSLLFWTGMKQWGDACKSKWGDACKRESEFRLRSSRKVIAAARKKYQLTSEAGDSRTMPKPRRCFSVGLGWAAMAGSPAGSGKSAFFSGSGTLGFGFTARGSAVFGGTFFFLFLLRATAVLWEHIKEIGGCCLFWAPAANKNKTKLETHVLDFGRYTSVSLPSAPSLFLLVGLCLRRLRDYFRWC